MKTIKLMKNCLITDNVKADLAGTVLKVDAARADALLAIGYAVEVDATEKKAAPAAPENKAAPAAPKNKGK